ncbi:Gfo/Idh/MocA family protein [Sphingobacterium chuzhouense]|uniref:Gfo/Idh/MocA family oxidoreductase n=1 Tax=Sphingobacterium chuzhouense TaxID=1742264 RepID=A0ABR7XR91_9SPHI|nr:Gfo/Idh/MocA family oxidoreductase [Sphingobacterium chuzhouense]MBD1421670.1 Gfo/Idh/MocA family oxidoreductase [Sphingobacterium chuzhouense]
METNRRKFIQQLGIASAGTIAFSMTSAPVFAHQKVKKMGIIGLDTSHSEMFTKDINEGSLKDRGYRVVAAYPHGSKDIPSALDMKPRIIDAVKKMGVEIVDSIDELLRQVDYILLESNDGRVHLEQAEKVIKARKPLFIDKPMAENLLNVQAIFVLADKYNVPVFSSSSLRYDKLVQEVKEGKIGKVLGADVYTPAEIEPNHIDQAWYMIHGVEMLFSVMGTGCQEVFRAFHPDFEQVVGIWEDGRIGSVRGIRKGAANIAGIAFGETGISPLGPFAGYGPLVAEILNFFDTGKVPVPAIETIEIFKFMEAAQRSSRTGEKIRLDTVS